MATKNTGNKSSADDAFGAPSVEETTERIRALNEKVIESAKAAGGASLDAYEKALQNLVDFETQVADGTQLDWVSAVAKAHTQFVTDVTSAYTKAARELLK